MPKFTQMYFPRFSVPDQRKTETYLGTMRNKRRQHTRLVRTALWRLSLMGFAFATLAGCYDPADNCKNDRKGKIAAMVSSQHFVKKQLTNPASAKFPLLSDQGVQVTFLKDCHFNVRSYVDAQNAFGGTVRTRYSIDIEFDPNDGGSWGRDLTMLH